jgi:aconitate hydratase
MAGKSNASSNKLASILSFRLSNSKEVRYYSIPSLEKMGFKVSSLPFSIRIVLESLLRNLDGEEITEEDVKILANWNPKNPADRDIPFKISRILMQDFTGVPAIVDLAAMRDYVVKKGDSPELIQPIIPIDLIIDHSVQVDSFNIPGAIEINQKFELERNKERYNFLKWGSQAFRGFRVFPPSAGICHQVNLEYLATCVTLKKEKGGYLAFPDTLVGTDSHTTMINGMGVVGFGVGGIEAEAALLGQAVSFTTPKVLGVELEGRLREGVTATDFALTLTRKLREKGVVNMFVEFFGSGLKGLSLPDRATLSNMCPEYGATVAIFPVDEETLRYMKMTGRSGEQTELVRKYYTAQGMFGIDFKKIKYSATMHVDLGEIEPSVSGPSQPKQQLALSEISDNFEDMLLAEEADAKQALEKISIKDHTRWSSESLAAGERGERETTVREEPKAVKISYDDGHEEILSDGDVVIASITSCTNTSNPSVMICAGLLAKKALEKGLRVNTRKVKTSLGPGSRVVTRYLEKAGLLEPLARLGFGLVGFGCITCIGNSGPLIEKQSDAINRHDLVVASVLSGNRNYEARIHQDVRANYLMSPPLVLAFAMAGTVMIDMEKEPLGKDKNGRDVYLRDIWPKREEIDKVMSKTLSREMFGMEYGRKIYNVNPYWNELKSPSGGVYKWEKKSSYIRLPPFFWGSKVGMKRKMAAITGARILAVFGDSISTDHISPAGAIRPDTPAGKYLESLGIEPADFNTYGARRGNHEVMMRGTFANSRIKNLMLDDVEGGFTMHYPSKRKIDIFDAATEYNKEGIPLIVIAGKEYGSGSSRDWAAKGPMLLGVRAVIAESFERIHRSNLVGMGILPLQFEKGENANKLKIDYSKEITIEMPKALEQGQRITMTYAKTGSSTKAKASLVSRLDSPMDIEYYTHGGVLNYVLAKLTG